MILKNHIFKLLIAFVIGILIAWNYPVHWVVVFTLWATSLTVTLMITHYGRKLLFFRKGLALALLLTFVFSGALSLRFAHPESQRRHFSNMALKGDQFIGSVKEFEWSDGDFHKLIVAVDHLVQRGKSQKATGDLLCYIECDNYLLPGERILLDVAPQSIENKNNPGGFDAKGYWATQGIYQLAFAESEDFERLESANFFQSFWERSRIAIQSVLQEQLSEASSSLAIALSLGDKSKLSQERRAAFADAGAMHVLAVSGMHVGILLGFLQWIFFKIKPLRQRNRYIYVALVLIWCFAFLTGLSASVFRATMMFTVLSVGQLRGYSFFNLNALFISAFLLLIIDAKTLFSIGFQLSFLAMLGISLFFQPIRNLIESRWKLVNYFWDATALGIAAQIGTIPISLYYFHQFPNYFVLTNLGLIVLTAAALIAVIVLLALSWVPFVVDGIAWLTEWIFAALNGVVKGISALPGAVSTGFSPGILWVVLIYCAVLMVYVGWSKMRRTYFRAGLIIVFILGVFMIYQREKNKSERALVFLNSSVQAVILKEEMQAYCLFESIDDQTKEKMTFTGKGYSKLKGVPVNYIPMENGESFEYQDVKVAVNDDHWRIDHYSHTYRLTDVVKNENEMSEQTTTVSADPSKQNSSLFADFYTDDGAITFCANGKEC